MEKAEDKEDVSQVSPFTGLGVRSVTGSWRSVGVYREEDPVGLGAAAQV